MIGWVLFALVLIVTVAYARGYTIPTPVPRHLARRGRDLSSGGLGLTLWRTLLVVFVVSSGLLTAALNPSGFLAFFAAGLFLWVFMEDLQKTLLNVWNLEFIGVSR